VIFYYLDASAWVKRYYRETGTRWVQDLLAAGPTVACAPLGLVEVVATLARKAKAREIGRSLFTGKVRELEGDWERFIQIHLTAEVVNRAKDLARRQALRGADAVHLASALLLQSRFVEKDDRLVFVASDQELKGAAQSSGLEVVDPEERERATTPQPGRE
jgi:predicted nucleic acid-binding protein